jgi:hypothetical protein
MEEGQGCFSPSLFVFEPVSASLDFPGPGSCGGAQPNPDRAHGFLGCSSAGTGDAAHRKTDLRL